uniref:F-box domain-containing protein n=1 Tax=Oryza barthii TaxID=65489 RepID=A0A0D3HJG2_9ORYZ
MPPGEAPPPTGGDRIGDLPDGVLQHILGFLPPHEAVPTCVLARRWRHLWKSVAALRITNCWDWRKVVPMEEFRYFVHHLLLRRGRAPIDEFELDLTELSDRDTLRVNRWFRHAVMCQARVLRLDIRVSRGSELELENLPVVSRHLQKLDIYGVKLMHSFLDFSSCPVLQHLEIAGCDLSDSNARKISSLSLKHLNISGCNFSDTFHTHIYAPNLLSLGLVHYMNRTPVFEGIPLLTEAAVGVGAKSGDWNARPRFDDSNNCMLPEALSQAKKLVLLVQEQDFNFEMYWQRCPTFSKLKTLLTSACASAVLDFEAVSCILRHSPVLENLTLQFHRMGHGPDRVEMKGSYSRMDRSSAISEYLKIVVVRFDEIDDLVIKFNSNRYWQQCPIFSRLKTLSICELISADIDFEALSCILQHSPILEKLTLKFRGMERGICTSPSLILTRSLPPLHPPLRCGRFLLCERDARHLFDGMRPGETGKRVKGSPSRSGGADEDRIGCLPDGVLHHILGFLPAPDAVRTCLLARRWRHLWKSATGLRISEGYGVEKLHDFVHHLLLLRGGAPLDTFELGSIDLAEGDNRSMNLWFRHALLCQVRVLRLNVFGLELHDLPFVSRHLVKLELRFVILMHSFLDFSSCPVLEHLEIVSSELSDAKRISSQSLKHLNLTHCTFSENVRIRIDVPNLLSLWLQDYRCRTPVFEVMPLLVKAFVSVNGDSGDWLTCTSGNADSEECPHDDCELCYSNTNCMLLQALSQARSLMLVSQNQEFVFKRDMMRCPTFSNLKTLLLIDSFYVAFDLHGITCILRHSPVLEKLTLELFCQESEHILEMKGSYNQTERSSAISEHLKSVVVKCGVIDERVTKVLKFLSTFNIQAVVGVAAESGDWNACPRFDDSNTNSCMLPEALSQAKKLVLEVEEQDVCYALMLSHSLPPHFNFKMYWQHCPTFSKLKTLFISVCISAILDFEGLSCILRHSPVLEILTLQFHRSGPDYCVEIKGSYSRMERSSAISEHLKIVVVKCGVVDERVIKILKFLSTFNIGLRGVGNAVMQNPDLHFVSRKPIGFRAKCFIIPQAHAYKRRGSRGARATDSAAGGRIRRACGARLGLLLAVVVDRRLIHQRLGDRRLFVSCRAVPFARHLFDGMPPRRRGSRGEEMAEASKEGGINALPDELLQHVLSLLSADEAVKTCVLSRRWRHLWRSTDVLRLDADKERWKSSKRFKKFVNHLVLFRGCSPLREFDLEFSSCREKDEKGDDSDEDESDDDRGEDESDEDSDGDESDEHSDDGESDDDSDEDEDSNPFQCVMMWVMYALICQVQVLKIHNFNERYIEIDGGMPLVSQHLTKIELSGIVLKDCFLNFSSCPALKELYFTKNCCFDSVKKIFSQSMQCLRIFCCQFSEYHRTLIYAPSLIRLFLEGFWGRTPFLERMPSLVEASVRPHQDCDDWCSNTYTGNCEDEDCDGCHGMIDKIGNSSNCVLLGGLSEAKSLKLIAGPEIIIFGSDLRWCPMFSKLKNLLLNEWCLLSNFWALACILEHSPVLRKLTLQISKEAKSMMQTEENDNPLRKPAAISEHLKVVKVHCKEVDEVVYKIGKWLSTLDIKVLIKRRNQSPKRVELHRKTRARRRHGHRHRRRRTSPTSSLATPPPKIESRYCSRVASYHGAPASHTGCFLHRGPDARRLFDGMRPQGKTLEMGKRALPRSSDGDEDRTGDLPDGILHHILGSLPARDAVRTCVLARRWRHLWKFATGLRITDREMREPAPMEKLQDFVDHLLLLRGRAPLETCWLNLTRLSSDGDARRVNLWFRHAVLCEVQVLRLDLILNGFQLKLDDLPLASRCLAKLNLSGVHLMHSFPDFSCCPVLEHLDIFFCDLSDAKKITSQSMKCLNIRHCTFSQISRTRISAPNLISLRLENYWHRTPVFEVMPLIVDAFVRVHDRSGDWYSCTSGNADFEECLCEDCDFCHSNTNCVIMQALPQAKNLVLSAHEQEFIFKRELMRCPTFSNLKTLLLINCFCVAFDLHGITSILRHTPVLEKLILEFFFEVTEHDDEVEMKGSCSQMERSSAISKHLKLVIVKCNAIDGRITKILKFLSTFNICFSFE